MTLPASGEITAAMINTELGRSSTAAFDMNGAAERGLAAVPSGEISFASFYGKSSLLATFATSYSASGTGNGTSIPGAATVSWGTDGYARVSCGGMAGQVSCSIFGSGTTVNAPNAANKNHQVVLVGTPGDFEVMFDTSDTLTSGTANTWLSGGTNRSWGISHMTNNMDVFGTIRVRVAGSGTEMDHAGVSLHINLGGH